MSKLRCPRCKSEIKENDTFCMSCGSPIRDDIKVKLSKDEGKTSETLKKDDVIIDNSNNDNLNRNKKTNIILIFVLLFIIVVLAIFLCYFLFVKKDKECEVCLKCPEQEVKVIEKNPTVQYINFDGYRFSIPLDWNFEGDTSDYKFTNKNESIYVLISNLDTISYSTFVSSEYQKVYLERLQSDYDIFITNSNEKVKDKDKYYLMEGTYESYAYIIVVTENNNGIFLTEAQFKNNSVYNSKKREVIDFALSYMKNDKI